MCRPPRLSVLRRHRRVDDPLAPPGPASWSSASGRWFVLGLLMTVLVLWGGLGLTFRAWRERYRERTAFALREVVPALRPMLAIEPPGVSRSAWAEAVAATEDQLRQVVGSDLLDRRAAADLRDALADRVAVTTPKTAVATLAAIWTDLDRRAGPVAARGPRPLLIEPACLVAPLADLQPPGIEPEVWRSQVAEFQGRLAADVAQGRLGPESWRVVRPKLLERTRQAVHDPSQSAEQFRWMLDDLDGLGDQGQRTAPG